MKFAALRCANARIDPLDISSNVWTGTWRDPRFSPPADGGRPENALSGTLFMNNDTGTPYAITVPEADGKMRLWRNTSIAALGSGQVATLPTGTLGYEWDSDIDNGARPAGLVRMSTTTLTTGGALQDYGSTYGTGTVTHYLTLYKATSGARVFGAGTIQWSWGLDANHDRGNTAADVRMQQATVNLLADMNAQPATLQAGLVAASASADAAAPVSTITSPSSGAIIASGTATTISGTASDSGGGVVGGVEVSVDGGTTWHPAVGRASWTYSWTPTASGAVTIKTRAVDDSGNLEAPGSGVNVTISGGAGSCPCTIWPSSAVPTVVSDSDTAAVNLGVKFRSDVNGYITGIRFYKGTANTGTHVGRLWTSSGTQLATATFSGETASGWQQVNFATPVAITANTVYVASYFAPNGRYAGDGSYFAAAGRDNAPLHALQNGASGGNGVYVYGSSPAFPSSSYNSSNYWVDVVFTTSAPGDTTPPTVTTTSPLGGATGVSTTAAITATFSEAIDPATISSSSFTLNGPGGAVAATVSYNASTFVATLTPSAALSGSSSYTATISTAVKDLAGNALATAKVWSFTTGVVDTTPPTVTASVPANGATGVSTTAAITATFSEAIDPATISSSSFTLSGPGGAVAATVSYNASTFVATLTPNAALAASTSYTATVTTAVKDLAGNALASNVSWSFTTAAGPTCPCTIWPSSATPATASVTDPNGVNLGVKFRADSNGYITGIRFYKGTANTGTHVGRLWSSSGTQLATATFSGETASGWQQVNFATPVAVTAGTVYVASYFAPNGNYAANGGYFAAAGVDNAPLHALQNGASGGNGVYVYGSSPAFPSSTYNSTNYWVDVVFTP